MHLEHFDQDEFREWADDMSPRQTVLMDVLRHVIGSPVIISAHPDSLGREQGKNSQSGHNVDRWGYVLAADVFVSGVYYREQAEDVVNTARRIGFTDIGVYSDTRNNQGREQVMFHLGTRPTSSMGSPATWGRVWKRDGNNAIVTDDEGERVSDYTSLQHALQTLPLGGKNVD